MNVDSAAWHTEIDDIGRYLDSYGARMPQQLKDKHQQVKKALG
jgi:phosphoenolpyruvate carboxykinase (GTP)